MKKLIALALILCLVGLTGCGSDDGTSSGTTDKSDSNKVWDLSDLYGSAEAYKCTAKVSQNGMEMDMDIWMKGDNERIESHAPQGTQITLFDGQMMYSWTKGGTDGIKMDVAKIVEEGEQQQTQVQSTEQMNQNAVDVDCKPATFPDSMFETPANVQFRDMNEMMEQIANMGNLPNMP